MSTLADAMLAWKVNLTTKVVPEQVLTLRADVNAFADDARLLESENVKLRELVKHTITHIKFTSEEDGEPMCWRCPYGKSESSCDFEQRVAALGIEVD